MPTRGAQSRFLEGVLGRQGCAGLKLPTVCEAVSATAESFSPGRGVVIRIRWRAMVLRFIIKI
ncbi:hypothetical protein [Rhodococcus erythropolis]|uniref:Uncharacterized protein n=1 Tax=Rhodococcus erythropolis (strain PR4 / NBRC 100887) TaxID=234621 RepID=C0ZQ43_RHOE4|nr:hypothetical protein [Rhodococcus erythropolis]BAH31521.1 hypothetical protein RER_08130 [Rhodococcus erythropolis PR4]